MFSTGQYLPHRKHTVSNLFHTAHIPCHVESNPFHTESNLSTLKAILSKLKAILSTLQAILSTLLAKLSTMPAILVTAQEMLYTLQYLPHCQQSCPHWRQSFPLCQQSCALWRQSFPLFQQSCALRRQSFPHCQLSSHSKQSFLQQSVDHAASNPSYYSPALTTLQAILPTAQYLPHCCQSFSPMEVFVLRYMTTTSNSAREPRHTPSAAEPDNTDFAIARLHWGRAGHSPLCCSLLKRVGIPVVDSVWTGVRVCFVFVLFVLFCL